MHRRTICRFHLFSALLLTVSGCASGGSSAPAEGPSLFFPSPPDTARIQFLTRIGSQEDVEGRKGKSFLDRLAGSSQRDTVQLIVRPYGIAVSPGRIHVCDVDLPGIEILDLERREFSVFQPTGPGALGFPISCAVDPATGRLFVADVVKETVLVFDSAGEYVTSMGSGLRPTDVLVDRDAIWVSYARGNRVIRYDATSYKPVATIPEDPEDPEYGLGLPTGLAVLGDELFVTDQGLFVVHVFARDGTPLRTIGQAGSAPGSFARPKGVAVSRDSVVYAVDAAFQNVQMFRSDGPLLMWFGGPYTGPGYMYMPADVEVDYDNLSYFSEFVEPGLELKYLIFVTNQLGPDKVSVYGFVGR